MLMAPARLWDLQCNSLIPFFLYFLPSLINIGIFLYATFFLSRTRLNNSFSFFVLLLAGWQFLEGLTHISANEATAMVWYHMSGIFTIGVIVFQMLFALRITAWQSRIPIVFYYLLLFFPAIFFIVMTVGGQDHFIIKPSAFVGWNATAKPTLFMDLMYGWIAIISILTFFTFFISYLKTSKQDIKRKQLLLLTIGFSAPLLGGLIGEILLPFYLNNDAIPVTTPLVTVFSILSLIDIRRYKLLDFSPHHHWENILKSMSDGLIILNLKGKIMYANDAMCQMTGYNLEELNKMNGEQLLANSESKEKLKQTLEARQGSISSQNHFLLARKNKDTIWAVINGFPYLDRFGNVIGTVGIASDVTELLLSQITLRKKINDLNMFFYKTSHDFKTPIASLQGLLECYEKDDNIDDLVKYSRLCIQNLSAIVDRVSQLSVIQQKQLNQEDVDFNDKIDNVLKDIYKHFQPHPSIRIERAFESKIIHIEKYLLNLILRHLIENAFRYYDPTKSDPYVKITLDENESNYLIKVADNGVGIDSSIQEKIFEMFYRGNDSSKGAGLGLYIVKSAVEKLEGFLKLESKSGVGTTFFVSLPKNKE